MSPKILDPKMQKLRTPDVEWRENKEREKTMKWNDISWYNLCWNGLIHTNTSMEDKVITREIGKQKAYQTLHLRCTQKEAYHYGH